MDNRRYESTIPVGIILFIVFLVLKLTHTIDWSWWWITSPIWIPVALAVVVFVVWCIAVVITSFIK